MVTLALSRLDAHTLLADLLAYRLRAVDQHDAISTMNPLTYACVLVGLLIAFATSRYQRLDDFRDGFIRSVKGRN